MTKRENFQRIRKVLMVCAVLVLVGMLIGVAGCTSPSSSPSSSSPTGSQTGPSASARATTLPTTPPANIQSYTGPFVGSKNSDVYHYPWCPDAKNIKAENLVVFATVADACAANYRPCEACNPPACGATPVPTPTPQSEIATDTTIYVPPVDMGGGNLNGGQVQQGQSATIAVVINAADGTHPCTPAVNYYVDDQAAYGNWYIPPNPVPGICSGGVMPHMELQLAGSDTAKFSLGVHTLKVDYLGDSKYAGSQSITQFTVTSPTPSPSVSPYVQLVGDSATHVYHLPSCSWVHLISAAHLVYFSSAAEAEAAGYRPCEHCHPPT